MTWADDPELTEPKDGFDRPSASILGDMRRGDSFTLRFEDDGERVERDHGVAARFKATVEAIDGRAYTWDDEPIEAGDEIGFETSSARLLAGLKAHQPVGGKTIEIVVEGTGMDAAYSVSDVSD